MGRAASRIVKRQAITRSNGPTPQSDLMAANISAGCFTYLYPRAAWRGSSARSFCGLTFQSEPLALYSHLLRVIAFESLTAIIEILRGATSVVARQLARTGVSRGSRSRQSRAGLVFDDNAFVIAFSRRASSFRTFPPSRMKREREQLQLPRLVSVDRHRASLKRFP